MPPKRVPIKGEPNFTNVSDEKLKGYIELVQQLLFSYGGISNAKVTLLKEIWKELSDEHADRLAQSAIKEIESEEEPEKLVCRRVKLKKTARVKIGT